MKFILAFLVLSSVGTSAWGMGQKPIDIKPGKVNYSAFPGEYVLIKSSGNVKQFCDAYKSLRIVASPSRGLVEAVGVDQYAMFHYEKINNNRDDFDSCWNDGMKGYSEIVGNGSVVVNRTIHLKKGFLCTGKGESCRKGGFFAIDKEGRLNVGWDDRCYKQSALCVYERR